ncbi:MAG: hypothetical protein IT466_07935 [Moraxellaceae bacterium]|jgi:hypothetical protein|nr:hypothetical protein [Moraxellaceae bacterium]MBP7229298.1 hypothetical protein [Moraxellaceae bacterium]MBP8851389.1 hypothetical protein [Moraxellaceae bacterium]MBP9044948.1 hypothetical protein [Moraxellaceae bacterium]MBP9730117.1 hypothetical protein [Moraxellaceae bacterium]
MNRSVVFLLVITALVVGWNQQGRILGWLQSLLSAVQPPPPPDVLYHTVDKQGVPQFTQEPSKNSKAVIYDGSKTTIVEAVRAPLVAPDGAGGSKPAGNEIMNLRNELEKNAQTMRENRDAKRDF